jgi:hypothetical protein
MTVKLLKSLTAVIAATAIFSLSSYQASALPIQATLNRAGLDGQLRTNVRAEFSKKGGAPRDVISGTLNKVQPGFNHFFQDTAKALPSSAHSYLIGSLQSLPDQSIRTDVLARATQSPVANRDGNDEDRQRIADAIISKAKIDPDLAKDFLKNNGFDATADKGAIQERISQVSDQLTQMIDAYTHEMESMMQTLPSMQSLKRDANELAKLNRDGAAQTVELNSHRAELAHDLVTKLSALKTEMQARGKHDLDHAMGNVEMMALVLFILLVIVGAGFGDTPDHPDKASFELQKPTQYTLGDGSMLVMHDKPVLLHTSLADIRIEPGTSVYVMKLGNEVGVYNLYDKHDHSVEIAIHGTERDLRLGEGIILTDGSTDYNALKLSTGIGLQNPQFDGNVQGTKVFDGGFSYLAALNTAPQFQKFVTSANADERKAGLKLLKLAAASGQ